MSQHHDTPNAIFELWDIVLRYRWRFVLPAFVVAALVLGVSMFLPRKYKATATFERRTDMVLTEMANRRGATRNFQDPRDATVEQITSPPAVAAALRQLEPTLRKQGFVRSLADLNALRDDMLRRLVVHWDVSTYQLDRIRVEYVGNDPQLSAIVVNTLIDRYILRAKDEMTSRLRESASFFQDEAQVSRAEIEKLEARVLDFEIQYGELLPESPNSLQTRLLEARESLTEANAARDAADTRVDALTRALQTVPDTIPTLIHGPNPEMTRLEQKLRENRDKLNEALNMLKMTEAHPEVVALRQQIALLEQQIAQTDAEVVTARHYQNNPQRAELELQLTTAISEHEALTKQAAALGRGVDKMDAAMENMYAVRSTHRKLTRQLDETQRQLAFWEDNLRQVDMALAADSGKRGVEMNFISRAAADARPVSPSLPQVFMAAIGLGLLAGGLAVFVAYRTDETFSRGERLAQHFGIPLFGSVSELITCRHRQLRRLHRLVVYPSTALVMGAVILALGAALYGELVNPDTPAAATPPTATDTTNTQG